MFCVSMQVSGHYFRKLANLSWPIDGKTSGERPISETPPRPWFDRLFGVDWIAINLNYRWHVPSIIPDRFFCWNTAQCAWSIHVSNDVKRNNDSLDWSVLYSTYIWLYILIEIYLMNPKLIGSAWNAQKICIAQRLQRPMSSLHLLCMEYCDLWIHILSLLTSMYFRCRQDVICVKCALVRI